MSVVFGRITRPCAAAAALVAVSAAGCGSSAADRVEHGGLYAPGPYARHAEITTASEVQLRPPYGRETGFGLSLYLKDDGGVRLKSVTIEVGGCLTLRGELDRPSTLLLNGGTEIPMRGRYVADTTGPYPTSRSGCVTSGGSSTITQDSAEVTVTDEDGDHTSDVELLDPVVVFVPEG